MDSYTIAHIADLHLSGEHRRFNLRRARRLLEEIARRRVDHVVVTGDIAADADRKELDIARGIFRNNGLLDTSKLSVVIGNHDIFGGVHTAEDILTFPRRCRHTDYNEKVEEFRGYFHEAFERMMFGAHGKPFPYAKVLGDVVLFGVNSVAHYSGVGNPVGSNGEVGDAQFKRLRQLLEAPQLRGKRKIVLIHHHFHKLPVPGAGTLHSVWGAIERRTMKLHGKKRLFELFREAKVDRVLHGHVHVNEEYTRKGVRFINGGGSLLGPGSQIAFNLLEIGPESIENRVITIPEEQPAIPASVPRPSFQGAELQGAGLQAA
ncbi:MAG TPA: metallophosphoesterase [Bacteroidota bacterium]|nr:metallophosphoesterase [Bacteroidota bacterium]